MYIYTYDKLKTAKFGFSIFDYFTEVQLKSFTLLINTAEKEIFNNYQWFFNSAITLLQTGQTNTQTHNIRV